MKMDKEEIWKDIPWYEWLYKVNNLGEVKSKRNLTLNQYTDRGWYKAVYLYSLWKRKFHLVHRLVLIAFIWDSKLQCNHIDWVKSNNILNNLEYCTRSENALHSYKYLWRVSFLKKWHKMNLWRKQSYKERNKRWKIQQKRVNQYTLSWVYIWTFNSLQEAKSKTWASNISYVCQWKANTSWGFIWKYK